MITDDHPYYDSKKRKNQEHFFFKTIFGFGLFVLVTISIATFSIIKWENANMIEIWVDYEAIVDQDKVILYKSHNPEDSMVFRIPCTNNPFKGVECIEKLEYRIP